MPWGMLCPASCAEPICPPICSGGGGGPWCISTSGTFCSELMFHFLLLVNVAAFLPHACRPDYSAALLAESEPSRFWSVGGNGIKLYSNMRPNASVKMRPAGKLMLRATWVATGNRNCHKPAENRQSEFSSYGNLFTLPLFTMRSEAPARFSDPVGWTGASNPEESAENLRIAVQFAALGKALRSHSNRHPQPVHKARLIIRPTGFRGKGNLLFPGPTTYRTPIPRDTQPTTSCSQTARATPYSGAARRRMARHRPPKLGRT